MSSPERRTRSLESDERYRQLVELAPDAILIHDGDRIVLANAAAVRLAGATDPDQLIGLPIDRFLDPPYLKAVEDHLVRGDETAGHTQAVPDRFRRLDGAATEVEVITIPFLYRDRLSAHVVVRDISERLAIERRARQVEERLQQVQRLEAVGQLAGGVAHEVNNMMTVVLGFSEFLVRDPGLSPERRQDASHITNAARRAATVTGQLLAFSRRAFHEPRTFDLGAALHDLEPVLRRLLGVDRELVLSTDGPVHVRFDPGQLEQVLINLALNGRDAMPERGTLTIATGEADLSPGTAAADGGDIPPGRYGRIVVRDTGSGMDHATQARIFEPFFTTKPAGHGTGLGLAAAYGILKQNDGYIAVASRLGEGASFSLYLPLGIGAPPAERPATPLPAVHGVGWDEATVLVVEDEAGVRAMAVRTLELGGFRVLQAADGASALAMVERHGPPDVVLTDLVMPGISGADLARLLGQRWPALPILFMSGYSVESLRQQGMFGAEAMTIQKPFSPESLVDSVTAALHHASARIRMR